MRTPHPSPTSPPCPRRPATLLALALASIVTLAGAVPAAAAGRTDGTRRAADDAWTQYRGPARGGTVAGPPLGASWPAAGPPRLWSRPAGGSFSQIVVDGDAAFTGASDAEQDHVVRLDAETGAEVWRTAVGPRFADMFGEGPRSTPTLDGERVFFLGGNGRLVALGRDDGRVLWSVELTERFGATVPRFGYSGSPLVVDGRVVVEVGGKDAAALVAFDAATGEVAWQALEGPAGYGSPLVVTLGGERQMLLIRGATLVGLDFSGKQLWSFAMGDGAIAMPVPVDGERVFVSTGGEWGCAVLRVTRGADGWAVTPVWQNREMRNAFNSSVLHDGFVYGFDNATLKKVAVADGSVAWAKRGMGRGSVAVADGRLFALSDQGLLVMLDTAAEAYTELGRVQAFEGRSWTAPSVAGGRLYVRNLETLTCFDLRRNG